MVILGVETSCDETAAAIVSDGSQVLSNVVASSLPYHQKTGGIIPEVAAREQSKAIIPVLEETILQAKNNSSFFNGIENIDCLAVTYGPGLVGPLFIGVETVKSLSFAWNKPIVPVNHLIGHLYSAWIENSNPPNFPLISLIVSGGHTELLLVKAHGVYEHLGGTRDDAAGEAFDKIARVLDLGYPGGPAIEKQALDGNSGRFSLPRPLKNSSDFDFSFSGLKTAAINTLGDLDRKSANSVPDFASSFQEAVVDILVFKTLSAARKYSVKNIVIGGGVAANQRLREKIRSEFSGSVYTSEKKYSVDNGAMVAAAAFYNFSPIPWSKVKADPSILF